MVVLDHFTFLGRGKTNHVRRNDYNLQQSDEEYCEDNVTGEENFKSNGFRGNSYRGQRGLRANRNFDRSASKRPVSSSSTTAGTFHSSKQANNQPEQQSKPFSLSNALPIHAQNPIFVEKFLPRFSSILPPSNLLAPETSVVKTPSTVLKRDFSENTNHSLVTYHSNASPGFLHHSKVPHNNCLTYESHFSKQPRGLIKGDSSTSRADYFNSASNDFSQGHENSSNKSPHLSFPIPSYNLPSIPFGYGESGSVNATFASISNNVTNGFRNSRKYSSNERHFKAKSFNTTVNNPENLNKTAVLSLNSPSHRVQDNYSQGLQENTLYSIAALEKGSRNNSGVSNQCRKDSSKVQFKNIQKHKFSKFPIGKNEDPNLSMTYSVSEKDSQNLIKKSSSTAFMDSNMMSDPSVHSSVNLQNNYGTNSSEGFVENGINVNTNIEDCGKVPGGDPNFLRSNFQSNLENIQPSVPNYPSENSSSRSVNRSKSKTDVNKTNLVNIMKEFGFGFNDCQENFPQENTNSRTTISNTVDTENFSLGSTLLSQLDTFESDGHRRTSKLSEANLSNYHNSGLPKPNTVAGGLKSNYSNKNESKLLPLALEPSKRNKAVSLEFPRQVEDISRAANYQRPPNISNEKFRDFPSECHKQHDFQSENNIRSFDSTKNCENIRLTDYTLTGQSFNIRQPARDSSHRAPSRTEVLERIEADYAVKAVEHAEKERLVSG